MVRKSNDKNDLTKFTLRSVDRNQKIYKINIIKILFLKKPRIIMDHRKKVVGSIVIKDL